MYENILVSVVITTYKRSEMLTRAINSALNQSHQNIEIVVIDDNDPNTKYRMVTEELMEQYSSNSKVRYVKHEYNKNGAAARNTGIKEAKGKYIAFLDDDDIFLPHNVETHLKAVENSDAEASYSGFRKNNETFNPVLSGNILFEILSGEVLIRTSTLFMNREIADKVGGWDTSYRRNQEVGLLARFFKAGYNIKAVNEVLIHIDPSDPQNASNAKKSEEDYLYLLHDQRENIEYASKITSRDKKIVYSYRLRTICLKYLAAGQYFRFLRAYLFSTLRFPVRFNIDFIKYCFSKIFGK